MGFRLRLFNEDCIDVMQRMPSNYVDLTITSPPYDSLRSYNDDSEWSFESFKAVADCLLRITKNGGIIVWNVNDSTVNGGKTLSSFRQALYFQDIGFLMHDVMIWQKSNFSNPSSTRYHQVAEYVFVLSKGRPKTFNPIKDRPNVYAGKVGSYGKNTSTRIDGSKVERRRKVNTQFGMRHNIWLIPTAGQTGESKKFGHPAMFPEQLARDHILSWSNKNDVVLDPFTGSGTTAVACLATGRKFVGCEISKPYFKLARRRIKQCRDI